MRDFLVDREKMVEDIRQRYGLDAPYVFSAMFQVPREEFAPKSYKQDAYRDGPNPIGYGQTMSQPYTVCFMTHLLIGGEKSSDWKVLEVGTGSGYQAAILSRLAKKIYTVEIIKDLAEKAKERLKKLGYKNVEVKVGSGEWGWREKAPFDGIIVTAGLGEKVPEALFDQLKEGGFLVAPMGRGYDKVMTKFVKLKNAKIEKQEYGIFNFVPFVEEPN